MYCKQGELRLQGTYSLTVLMIWVQVKLTAPSEIGRSHESSHSLIPSS